MKQYPNYNTYISINLMIWKPETGIPNHGRIYTSVDSAKLDMTVKVDYKTAQRELAKLMARTGKMPDVIGKDDPEMTLYTLSAFLE